MAARRQVPLILLTGFLGSGKTSLLRQWLAEPEFANTLVLVNEIGEVGVDQQLLAPGAGDPLLLENGCICCDAGGDLVATLEQLFFERLHRKIPSFNRVVVETTGLAAPSMALKALSGSETLRERYEAPFVLSTFDAKYGPMRYGRHAELRDQAAAAHALILTRTDLATRDEIDEAAALLARERPDAPVHRSGRERVGAQAILDMLKAPRPAPHGLERGDVAHTPQVSTAFAPHPDPVSEPALRAALGGLFREAGPALLRAKGFVDVIGAGACLVQADAAGIRLERIEFSPEKFGMTLISETRLAADLAASLSARLAVRKLGR
jgi:G3E family GTPase